MAQYNKRALFVHLNWIITSYTCHFVNALVDAGYSVDFVTTKRSKWRFVNYRDLRATVIEICTNSHTYDLLWKCWRILSIVFPWIFPVDPFLRRSYAANVDTSHYDIIICTEKESLLTVYSVDDGFNRPTFYWSLELYNEGYPLYFKYRRLNERARALYSKLSGFFIQDPLRWQVIEREVNSGLEPYFLPVTSSGHEVRVSKTEIRRKFGISQDVVVFVVHGIMNDARGLNLLAEMAQSVGSAGLFLIQGQLEQNLPAHLPENIRHIDMSFAENELMEFIAMADIGLAIYTSQVDNDRLIAFSSHKLAIYSRCGVPYISFSNESYERLDDVARWGERISYTGQFGDAAKKICANYPAYVAEATSAFRKVYSIDAHAHAIAEYIERRT